MKKTRRVSGEKLNGNIQVEKHFGLRFHLKNHLQHYVETLQTSLEKIECPTTQETLRASYQKSNAKRNRKTSAKYRKATLQVLFEQSNARASRHLSNLIWKSNADTRRKHMEFHLTNHMQSQEQTHRTSSRNHTVKPQKKQFELTLKSQRRSKANKTSKRNVKSRTQNHLENTSSVNPHRKLEALRA